MSSCLIDSYSLAFDPLSALYYVLLIHGLWKIRQK